MCNVYIFNTITLSVSHWSIIDCRNWYDESRSRKISKFTLFRIDKFFGPSKRECTPFNYIRKGCKPRSQTVSKSHAHRKLRNDITFRVSVDVMQIRILSTPCPFPWIRRRRAYVAKGGSRIERGISVRLTKRYFVRRRNGSKLLALGLK